MSGLAKWLFIVLVVASFFAIGSDTAYRSFGRVKNDRKEKSVCLAKIDLWAYLLTLVPLIGILVIGVNTDPIMGQAFVLEINARDFVAFSLAIVAAAGAGAGIARRRLSIQLAKE